MGLLAAKRFGRARLTSIALVLAVFGWVLLLPGTSILSAQTQRKLNYLELKSVFLFDFTHVFEWSQTVWR